MDHLPTFKYMVEPYPRVPLLTDQPYDGLGTSEYHVRQGFDLVRLLAGDFSQHCREKTASFLQNWLFFGHLHEILSLGKPFDQSRFIEIDDLGFRVCTAHLDGLVTEWGSRVAELQAQGPADYQALLDEFDKRQNTLNLMYHRLLLLPGVPLPQEVMLSVAILACTFDLALLHLFDLGRDRRWGLDTIAAARMTEAGWCPRDIALTKEVYDEIPMLCASYMERRSVDFDHWNCSSDTCQLNNIDETTYVTQHRDKGCQCQFFYPDQAEICRILSEGDIPVVYLTSAGKDTNGVTILDGMKVVAGGMFSRPYVAISHVWSDGMGNPHQNSIPFCQLRFLYDRLNAMSLDEVQETVAAFASATQNFGYKTKTEKVTLGAFAKAAGAMARGANRLSESYRRHNKEPVALWLDTLCVPLEPKFRKVAIAGMKDVYAKAGHTLVVESEIMAFDHEGCSDEELAMRIALSGWMRRAWTFQEGFLASFRLRFLFNDGPSRFPLWRDEMEYMNAMPDMAMPFLYDSLDKIHSKKIKFAARQGKTLYYHDPGMPQAMQEELEREARTFTMRSYTLAQTKPFFQAMRTLWSPANVYSPPLVLITRMIAVWNHMKFRETSRQADKFLCFAMSCALGTGERQLVENLLSLPAEQRMKGWVQAQSVVPSELLFIPGERYQDLGFKWLPSGVHRVMMEDIGWATRDKEDGLLVFEKPGFVIMDVSVQCSVADDFIVRLMEADGAQHLYSVTMLDSRRRDATMSRKATSMAVILQRKFHVTTNTMVVRELGALLECVVEAHGRVRGEYVGRVMVGKHVQEKKGRESVPLLGKRLESAKWVVF